jgi:hypothetical protein
MNFTRAALTVGLAFVAASLLLTRRDTSPLPADDGLEPFPSLDPGWPSRTAARTAAPAGESAGAGIGAGLGAGLGAGIGAGIGAAATGGDSPNDAERLQARGVAASDDGGWRRDPLRSTSQEGAEARAPGLPDFARGA